MTQPRELLNPRDLEKFAQTLHEFGQTLDPRERALLYLTVERAADVEPSKVRDYTFGDLRRTWLTSLEEIFREAPELEVSSDEKGRVSIHGDILPLFDHSSHDAGLGFVW
jgi:hypothetical protein